MQNNDTVIFCETGVSRVLLKIRDEKIFSALTLA